MIKIEHTDVYGFEAAIRGMRNPWNSWEKSDSLYSDAHNCEECAHKEDFSVCYPNHIYNCFDFIIGDNDLALMKKLVSAGTDHSKFMRMINVTVDITAPMYWWSEYDTYKVGTVRNSCSKMHKLLSRPFEISDFSFDKLVGYRNEVKQFRPPIDEDIVANEVWVDIDKEYSVSNFGRVKHKFTGRYRLISGSIHSDGYVFVTLHGEQIALHRLIAKTFHRDSYHNNLVVNHIDGNKQNNFADNLEWVTQQKNIQHSHNNGFQPKSISTYTGKFTAEQREEIKRLWDSGEKSKREIARMYGVSHTCINDIISDKYKYAEKTNVFEEVARPIVDTLNELRDSYLNCNNEEDKKRIWYSILQLLPSSYNQRATVQLNYAVLRNMYHARKNHPLDEWRDFCRWIETLPYSELITGGNS